MRHVIAFTRVCHASVIAGYYIGKHTAFLHLIRNLYARPADAHPAPRFHPSARFTPPATPRGRNDHRPASPPSCLGAYGRGTARSTTAALSRVRRRDGGT